MWSLTQTFHNKHIRFPLSYSPNKGIAYCHSVHHPLYFIDSLLNYFLSDNSTTAEIPLSEVSVSQLVAYDSEKDLLPVMLANCSYSLEVGKETSSQYNWEALQKQIIDRFIRGRPTVEFQVTISSIRGKKNSLSKRQNYTILDVLRKFANKSFKAVNGNLTFQPSLAFSLK